MPGGHKHTTSRNYDRMWEVRIWLRGDEGSAVISQFATLAPALEACVKMAEQKGWAGAVMAPEPTVPR
jgi:predicted Zn-dependent protease